MRKFHLFFLGFFTLYIASFGQVSNEKMLFVIDSIPLLYNPEDWNQILPEDIADITVLKNKDTLRLLGLDEFDGVTYVFTNEYRSRKDSLREIPSLKQMIMKKGVWNLHDIPYSGNYIDYYNNGRIQNEGSLSNGKLHGELVIYFQNSKIKSRANYKDGIANGAMNDYYKNGILMQTREYINGNADGVWNTYFINGQIENEKKLRKRTCCDTFITYYSTGKVKQMKFIRNGIALPDKKADELNYYTSKFNQSLQTGDLKEANKYAFKLFRTDSTRADTYFIKGLLLYNEFRFEKAIAEFDKALEIEPLMRESLAYRGLARIKKYRFLNPNTLSEQSKAVLLSVNDIIPIPKEEQEKICNDIKQAEYVDFSEYYIKKLIPETILNYCNKR